MIAEICVNKKRVTKSHLWLHAPYSPCSIDRLMCWEFWFFFVWNAKCLMKWSWLCCLRNRFIFQFTLNEKWKLSHRPFPISLFRTELFTRFRKCGTQFMHTTCSTFKKIGILYSLNFVLETLFFVSHATFQSIENSSTNQCAHRIHRQMA